LQHCFPLGAPEVIVVVVSMMLQAGCGLGCLVILATQIPLITSHHKMIRTTIITTKTPAVHITAGLMEADIMEADIMEADIMEADLTVADLTVAAVAGIIIELDMRPLPKKSPEPTAVEAGSSVSRFTSRVGGGSAFFGRLLYLRRNQQHHTYEK